MWKKRGFRLVFSLARLYNLDGSVLLRLQQPLFLDFQAWTEGWPERT